MSHPCRNYCSQWNGEQCKGCMISDEVDFVVGDSVIITTKAIQMDERYVHEINEVTDREVLISSEWFDIKDIRFATLAEKAAGYRIDETEEGLAAEAAAWRDSLEQRPVQGGDL